MRFQRIFLPRDSSDSTSASRGQPDNPRFPPLAFTRALCLFTRGGDTSVRVMLSFMTSIPDTASRASAPVGLVGLGLVGTELAQRLIAGGKTVVGFDLKAERTSAVVQAGGRVASSTSEVLRTCNRVLLSLPSHREVDTLIRDHDADFRSGQVIIDTTTGDPASSERLATRLKARGIQYLDATISGSSKQIRAGAAVMMVGGELDAFAASQDLFDVLMEATFHTGPSGSGAKMKLVTNLVLGLNRAVLAEGLAFAEGLSLDPVRTLEVMRRSPAYSRSMDVKGDKMIRRDFSPDARLSQHLKDVRLIVEAGVEVGLPMTLSLTHRELLEQAEAEGWGEFDNSAIIQVLSARRSRQAGEA